MIHWNLIPQQIVITDTTLRDGLQNLDTIYDTKTKLAVLKEIVAAGIQSVELTSFMRPDRVPQLSDAEDLCAAARATFGRSIESRALVANARGLDRALAAQVDTCVVLVTLSDSYCRRNQGMGRDENLELACALVKTARSRGQAVDISFSMPIFCPYEGDIAVERLVEATCRLVGSGAEAFTLCTSTGLENPREVCERVVAMRNAGASTIGLHLHDTNGMALASALAGLLAGVTRFETALAGLGGGIELPDGMPAHGNLPTEDLAHLLAEIGLPIDAEPLAIAAMSIARRLGVGLNSRAGHGATKRRVQAATNDENKYV